MQGNNDAVFSHILQKTGVLKNFSIAKIVPIVELEELKKEIKKKTKSEEEFNKMFQQKIAEYSNMHDPRNPIPGIIYLETDEKNKILYLKYAKEWAKKMKGQKISRKDLAFIVKVLISELGLTKDDFIEEENEQEDEDSDLE